MNIRGTKNKPVSLALILIVCSIVLRIIVYMLLPAARPIEQYSNTEFIYFSSLTEHFGDYIRHITLIPPASYIINASVFLLLGVQKALHIRAFVILVSLMDMIAVWILFKTMIKAGVGKRLAFLLLCLYSAMLVPFELWREGMHYDQHTILFVSFFVWSLVTLIKNQDRYGSMIYVSIAGGLLVTQSAVNSAVVPFSIILISCVIYINARQYKKLVVALLVTLFLPIFFLVLISKKNQTVGEEALTSNKAGPAMMMVVQRSYRYDTAKIRKAIIESGAPGYYLWAYDHASNATDPATGKPDKLLFTLFQAFGVCFFSEDSVGKTGPFGFDFHPLLTHLRENDSLASFTRLVEMDSVDARYKPYRLAGYSPELTPSWIGIYGDVSKKIFFKTLLKNPVGMLRSFIIQQGIFSIYGPLFPYNTMRTQTNLLARSGLKTLPGKIPFDFFFAVVVLVYAVIAWITYAIVIGSIPLVILLWLRKKRVSLGKNYFLLLSIPVLLLALVFSCLVGGENDRYFMQITPYIILLAALLPGLYKTVRDQLVNSTKEFRKS